MPRASATCARSGAPPSCRKSLRGLCSRLRLTTRLRIAPAVRRGDETRPAVSEIAIGFYVGGVANLAVVALLNNSAWEPNAGEWLVTLGAANEVLGLVMIASPELLPLAQRAGHWLIVLSRRAASKLASLLGLPRHYEIHAEPGHFTIDGSVHTVGLVGPKRDPSLEESIAWLIERESKNQEEHQRLERLMRGLPEEWRTDIAQARQELEMRSEALVQRWADRHLHLRLLGVAYVVLGLVLAWLGNVL
jgi:hypothetical protein